MIEFTKMSGAGNDFIVFDNRSGEFQGDIAEVVRRLCSRGLSVGADGVILVGRSKRADVRMEYWNSDGGRAEFCANGTRCVARFAVLRGFARGPRVRIETDQGVLETTVHADEKVSIPIPGVFHAVMKKPIRIDALSLDGSYAMAGVPHYVVPVKNLWVNGIEELGRKIRNHPEFQPDGINVDFVTVKARDLVQIRTYERGVEKETLSCGSGCVAAALVLANQGQVDSPVSMKTRSGLVLTVSWESADPEYRGVLLTGDARNIFQGFIEKEAAGGFPEETETDGA